MAQTYNFDGVNIVIPGSYVKTTVLNSPSGIATTGVIALVGEADSGPAYNDDGISKDLKEVAFTPDQAALVKNQFGGGDLVEAFNAAVAPLLQTGLAGGPTLVYCLKTNATDAAKAEITLQDDSTADIATFKAKRVGKYGNGIKMTATADAPVNGIAPVTLTTNLNTTNETFVVNTKAGMRIDYTVTDKILNVTTTSTTISLVDDASPQFNKVYTFSEFNTLNDLVSKIDLDLTDVSRGTCTIPSESSELKYETKLGELFDVGSFAAAGQVTGPPLINAVPARITICGYQLKQIDSVLVDVTDVTFTKPDFTSAILSPTSANGFLSGGDAGYSTQADIKAALAKLENIRLNFVVPLFSATSTKTIDDVPVYTIDQVIADTVDHVMRMSYIKARKNRQAFLSYWKGTTTYADVKSFVSSTAKLKGTPSQYRTSMTFQKVTVLNSSGTSETFLPWMTATLAAASQCVAGYRPIFNKAVNCSAIVDPADFDGDYEGALFAGLLTMRLSDDGFSQTFLSDQTTYLFPDNNFVYNSIQAVYGADVIAMTLQQQMQTFVGQSVADVTAGVALGFLKSVLANLLRNKWIAASSDAPAGFKNASVSINVPVMNVAVEVKESTGIYFVPINLSISGVSSTA